MDTSLSVKLILQNSSGKVLILKDSRSDWWDLPGGHVQVGETLEAALKREVKEETGLDIGKAIPKTTAELKLGEEERAVVFFHTTISGDPEITLSGEHTDFKWITRQEAKEYNLGVLYQPLMDYSMEEDMANKSIKSMAIKMVDSEKGIIRGLLCPYGGLPEMGYKDTEGEYFSVKTDFWEDRLFPGGRGLPGIYHHGLDKTLKCDAIGVGIKTEDDEEGKWLEAQLDMNSRWYNRIKTLIEKGKAYFSSDAVDHFTRKSDNGHINQWPLVAWAITPSPANPLARISGIKAMEILQTAGVGEENIKAIKEGVMPNFDGSGPPEGTGPMTGRQMGDCSKEGEVEMKTEENNAETETSQEGEQTEEEKAKKADGEVIPAEDKKPEAEDREEEMKAEDSSEEGEKPEEKPDEDGEKCNARKAIELPEEVHNALLALQDSVNNILGQVSNTSGDQPAEAPPEESEEEKAKKTAEGDKPPEVSEPGVSQGMSPENHEVKASGIKAMQDAIEGIKAAYEGEIASLKGRLEVLEGQPANFGPVRRVISGKFGNLGEDVEEKVALKALIEDPSIPEPVRQWLGHKSAMLDMEEIYNQGPQRLR